MAVVIITILALFATPFPTFRAIVLVYWIAFGLYGVVNLVTGEGILTSMLEIISGFYIVPKLFYLTGQKGHRSWTHYE